MDTINVIYVEPGKTARTIEMKDELSEMQKLVGGLIKKYTEKFRQPEQFFRTPAGIKAVKYEPEGVKENELEQR